MKPKIISDTQVVKSYKMIELIEKIETMYKLYAEGKVVIPERVFSKTEDGGDFVFGAATNLESKRFITMGSPFMPWNAELGKPIVTGYYLLINYKTGELIAVVDGTSLVNFRTGAKSAVAAKYLAKNNSKVLGIIGLGQQAKTQAEALCKIFDIEEIFAYTPHPKNKSEHIGYIKDKCDLEVKFDEKEKVIQKSDILVVATTSKKPLVNYKDLHKGQLVISLAHSLEVDTDLVKNCKTYIDLKKVALNEYGPVKEAIDNEGYDKNNLAGDLSELVSGKVEGRESENEIIYLQSLGVMHENLGGVEYVLEKV